MIEIVLEKNGILSVDLGDVFLGRVDLAGGVRVQCLLPALIWEILEGDPIEDILDQDAIVGESLKWGLHRAIKDDVCMCLILDCSRCPTCVRFVRSS